MPISIGSFGDIVAALQLAWQIRAALSDAAGARAEIDALIADLDAFTAALQQVQSSIARRAVEPAVANGIAHAIAACTEGLCAIDTKIAAFKARTAARDERAWKRYWALAAWSVLGGREEIDRLRKRLSDHVQAIHTFLFLTQMTDFASLRTVVEQQGATLSALGNSVHSIHVMLKTSTIPQLIWDPLEEKHYVAYARTSLPRLQALHAEFRDDPFVLQPDGATGQLSIRESGPVANLQCEQIGILIPILAESGGFKLLVLSCIFWRENPSDHWQVLVGMPGPWRGTYGGEDGLRTFLERPDIHTSECACRPACRELLLDVWLANMDVFSQSAPSEAHRFGRFVSENLKM